MKVCFKQLEMSKLVIAPQATIQLSPPDKDHRSRHEDTNNVASLQSDVQSVFEKYAALYPNSRLSQERHERDNLIRAVMAAGEATELNPSTKQKSKQGLWGRLFGNSNDRKKMDSKDEALFNNFDESRLRYINQDMPENHALCGTQNYSLDVDCIPPEAYMMARFRIASRHRCVNVARNSWYRAGSIIVVITGLGQVAEVPSDDPAAQSDSNVVATAAQSGCVWSTSDRFDLEAYVKKNGLDFSKDSVRACLVGPYFMMVSWGLADGVVVCYRKVQRKAGASSSRGWLAVAKIGPTEMVRSRLADIFSEDEGSTLSPLLTVTDVVSLVVETGEDSVPDVSLALSRLGGFIEIVPLPSRMWYGTEIAPRKPQAIKKGSHYASALTDLAMVHSISERIVSIPTLDYHGDIMGIDAFRTRVKDDTVWDQRIYPDRPPAEHVLIAYGCDSNNQTEQLSFWAVSTLFSAESDSDSEVNFSLHATLAEAIDLGPIVPPLTVFATDSILRHWRKPRTVELREINDDVDGDEENKNVTTISLPLPLVAVRSSHTVETTMLAALDAFGGVSLLDCSLLERLVSQCLADEEREQILGADSGGSVPLADFLHDRTHIAQSLASTLSNGLEQQLRICDVHFVSASIASQISGCTTALAFLTNERLWMTSILDLCSGKLPISVQVGSPKHDSRLLHVSSRHSLALFVTDRLTNNLEVLSISSLLAGSHLVEKLIRDGRDLEAMKAAESLGPLDRGRLQIQLDACHRRVWESRAHIGAFFAIGDESYKLEQVTAALDGKISAINASESPFILVRSMLEHVIDRVKNARLGSAVTICGAEGVDATLRRLRCSYIALGTYELISLELGIQPTILGFSEDFSPAPLQSIAVALAQQGAVRALSILYFRHSVDIGLDAICQIPLCVDLSLYQHLLPVVTLPDDETLFFIAPYRKEKGLLPFASMHEFLQSTCDLKLMCSDTERFFFSVEQACIISDHRYHDRNKIEAFYLNRIQDTEKSLGSLDLLVALCDVSLQAVRSEVCSESEVVAKLQTAKSNASLLSGLLGTSEHSEARASDMISMKTFDVCTIDASDLLFHILRMNLSARALREAVHSRVRPRLSASVPNLDEELESLIVQNCQRLISTSSTFGEMVRALESTLQVFVMSRSTLQKSSRLLKRKRPLLDLLHGIVKNVSDFSKQSTSTHQKCPGVIELLWEMYECLPVSFQESEEVEDESCEKADYLKLHLILGDIVSQWTGCDALSLMRDALQVEGKLTTGDALKMAIKSICETAVEQICSSQRISDYRRESKFLDLAIHDLREILLLSAVDGLDDLVTTELLLPLLQKMKIPLVRHLLEKCGNSFFNMETVANAIISFTDDVIIRSEDQKGVEAAIACEDLLGNFFPDLQSHFQSIRKCLDIAYFVNSVLFLSTPEYMTPGVIKELHPLEVMKNVLTKNPGCVVKDCEDWKSEDFGVRANRYLREQQSKPTPETVATPPNLPGGAVFHLAELLGLVDDLSVVIVKCFVIQTYVSLRHFSAAAAICRTLLASENSDSYSSNLILQSVVLVVNDSLFLDSETRFELMEKCLYVLSKVGFVSTDERNNDPLSILLSVYAKFQTDLGEKAKFSTSFEKERTTFEPVKMEKLSHHLDEFSNRDFCRRLGRDLLKSSMAELLSTNSRPSAFVKSRMTGLLDLGIALLFHSGSVEFSRRTLDEILAVLESSRETCQVGNHFPSEVDESVVRKLIGMGYHEIGARRAAQMSGNSGFDKALQWAVTHSGESWFNEPVMFLKGDNAPCDAKLYDLAMTKVKIAKRMLIDQESLLKPSQYDSTKIQDSQAWAGPQLSAENEELPSIKGQGEEARLGTTIRTPHTFGSASQQTINDPVEEQEHPVKSKHANYAWTFVGGKVRNSTALQDSTVRSPVIPNGHDSEKRSMETENNELRSEITDRSVSVEINRTERSLSNFQRKFTGETNDQEGLSSNILTASGEHCSSVQPEGAASNNVLSHGENGSTFNASELYPSRVELRKIGLEALRSGRTASRKINPADEERRRLIEEGRRLLQLTRPSGTLEGKRISPLARKSGQTGRNVVQGVNSSPDLDRDTFGLSNNTVSSSDKLETVPTSNTNLPTLQNASMDLTTSMKSDDMATDKFEVSNSSEKFEVAIAASQICENNGKEIVDKISATVNGNASESITKQEAFHHDDEHQGGNAGWDFDDEQGSNGAGEDDGWDFDDNI